jgi:hypothetical protein
LAILAAIAEPRRWLRVYISVALNWKKSAAIPPFGGIWRQVSILALIICPPSAV